MSFRDRESIGNRSALLLGATGATGSQVLNELLERSEWTKVVVLSRRPLDENVSSNAKLETIIVDFNNEEAEIDTDKLKGLDHFFNCIGTTRSSAGSAEKFMKVEVKISEKVAQVAESAGIESASVISAQGANPNQWGPTWFHPLFYGKVIGMKEEVMKSHFNKVTLFRPGMLNRGPTDRFVEKMFQGFGLDVKLLAKAMVNDAESKKPESKETPVVIAGNGKITKLSNL